MASSVLRFYSQQTKRREEMKERESEKFVWATLPCVIEEQSSSFHSFQETDQNHKRMMNYVESYEEIKVERLF